MTKMIITPICHYDPDAIEHDTRCARCGRIILYTHIAMENDVEIPLGNECVERLRASGEIEGRLPRNGRYDWKMSDVRQAAYWDWYAASLDHAI